MVLGCTLATFCTLFYWLVPPIHGAKIGVVPPIMFESHLYIFQHLAHTLHHKGHTMVFIVSEGRNVPNSPIFRVQRYPGLFDSNSADAFLQTKVQNILSGRLTSLELLDILDHYSKNCDIMMGDADLLSRLQHEAFDLILVDPNEICGFVLAHVLGVPHAMFSTGLWFPAEIGAPAPLSYVPEFNSELTDEMGLWQRLKNGAFYIVSRIGTRWLIFPRYDRILAQHNTVPALPMATIIEKSAVFMLCTDLALEFPRPTLPHVVYVGGVLTRPAQLLPQIFSEWAKASGPNGFVLVSFGAGIKHLSNELTNTFAGALAQLPYQVIWRYFGKSPKNLGNNTWLVEWVPQNDLLGHPNARAFISHGGLNGIYEAVYHSVPVVGLPIFGDHYDTMTRVHAKGMGIKLDWRRLTEQKLAHTIITVASDSRYKEKAVLLSRIYRDQEHPVKRAVHWIEYVLRHDGAPHLRPRVYDLSFYTYFLLDLLAIGVCFGLFLGWVVLVFLRWRSLRALGRLQASSACCIGDGGQTGHAFRQKLD